MTPNSEIEALEICEDIVQWVYYLHMRVPVPGLDKEDLLQAGRCGVILAFRTFDVERGTEFKTWAYSKIRWAMREEWQRMDFLTRTDRKKIWADEATKEEWQKQPIVLENWEECVAETSTTDGVCFDSGELEKFCRSFLSEREWNFLYSHIGLTKTYEEIGVNHGLSRERCRQIVDRALWKVRAELKKTHGGIYGSGKNA